MSFSNNLINEIPLIYLSSEDNENIPKNAFMFQITFSENIQNTSSTQAPFLLSSIFSKWILNFTQFFVYNNTGSMFSINFNNFLTHFLSF